MQDRFNTLQQLVLLALFFLMTLFFRPAQIFAPDHQSFLDWSIAFVTQGIPNAFRVETFNYGPTSVYFLYLFATAFGSHLDEYHRLMRQVFFLFDLGAIFVLMRYLEQTGRNATRAFFVLFNLAFLYNALIWGQTDGVMTALLLCAIVAGLVGKPELAGVLFVVVFNLKPQPIVMLPVVVLVLIPTFVRQPLRIVTTCLAAAGVQFLLLIPFLQNGEWRQWIMDYIGNTELYPFASVNAYNAWHLLLQGNPIQILDSTSFFGVMYKTWGVLMFVCFAIVVLLPLVGRIGVVALQRTPFSDKDGMLVFLAAGMISLGFFFFNTQMHERYAYPAILFLGAYAVMARDYILYILVSVAHLLNINAILPLSGFSVPVIHRFFTPEVVAGMFLVAVVIGTVQLYRMAPLREDASVIFGAARTRTTRGAPAALTTP